jgi:hypothetical protein
MYLWQPDDHYRCRRYAFMPLQFYICAFLGTRIALILRGSEGHWNLEGRAIQQHPYLLSGEDASNLCGGNPDILRYAELGSHTAIWL